MRNPNKSTLVLILLLSLISAPAVAAQDETSFRLENGIEVTVSRAAAIPYFTAVLVCPLPPLAGDADRAAAAMLNRLLWSGGEGFGTSVKEYEYGMIAMRFNGSIGSQLTPDALLIHYTMPTDHLQSTFKYMALQWKSLSITPEGLESARRKVAAEEEAGITASVLRQLMRELEPRIWSDLDYRFRGYGGAAALRSVDEERIRAFYARMIRPADWKLYVSGQVGIATLRAALQETLATISPAEIAAQPVSPEGQPPQLGVRFQLPARLSQRHAVAAYRLPPAAELDSAALLLLVRYLNNSPAIEALRNELGASAQVNVGFDLRRQAGIAYIYASWDDKPELGDVAARLAGIAEEAATAEIDPSRLERTRKALLIDYWTRRQATQPYALWRAGRLAVGLSGDDLPEKLAGLTEDQLKSTAANLLKSDNRVNLVTVPR